MAEDLATRFRRTLTQTAQGRELTLRCHVHQELLVSQGKAVAQIDNAQHTVYLMACPYPDCPVSIDLRVEEDK